MTLQGIYERMTENGLKRTRARFESTGVKNEFGKVIWRMIKKDNTPSNIFAEQFEPNVPWAMGKWFLKLNGAAVLRKHPQLKVETERSKEMTDEEYLKFLDSKYLG